MGTRCVGVLDVRADGRQSASGIDPVPVLLRCDERAACVVAPVDQVNDRRGGRIGLDHIANYARAVAHSFAAVGVKRLGADGAGVADHDAARDERSRQVDAVIDTYR